MVWTIEILAIPACGEVVDGHDASWARFFGKVWCLETPGQDGLEAGVPEAW